MINKLYFLAVFLILFIAYSIPADDYSESAQEEDSLVSAEDMDSLSENDEIDKETTGKNKKLKIIRKKYSYRKQLGSALGMMFFLAIILTSVQNWNPD